MLLVFQFFPRVGESADCRHRMRRAGMTEITSTSTMFTKNGSMHGRPPRLANFHLSFARPWRSNAGGIRAAGDDSDPGWR